MTFEEALDYIEECTKNRGSVLGLEGMRILCRRLGNPQDALKFIHIAGTNGKGSVLAYLTSILKHSGYCVGVYSSPTIDNYLDRIRIGQRNISKADFCANLELIISCIEDMEKAGEPLPTAFEIETALSFLYFKQKGCELVVLETGLGGKEDATNVVSTTVVSVITSISMDHMQFLGNSLAEIAMKKAGIIKPSVPVVSGIQKEEAMQVIISECGKKNSKLAVPDKSLIKKVKHSLKKQQFSYKEFNDIAISLLGLYQIDNAVIALEAVKVLRELGYRIGDKQLKEAMLLTSWPARFEIVDKSPLFIIDGAHNEDGARRLAESIEYYLSGKRIIYIMGVLKDKDYEKVISLTHSYADQIFTIQTPNNSRALPALDLAKAVSDYHENVTALSSVEEAVEISHLFADKDTVILAFGSLSFMGDLRKIINKQKKAK